MQLTFITVREGGLAAEPSLRKLMYNCYKGTHALWLIIQTSLRTNSVKNITLKNIRNKTSMAAISRNYNKSLKTKSNKTKIFYYRLYDLKLSYKTGLQ